MIAEEKVTQQIVKNQELRDHAVDLMNQEQLEREVIVKRIEIRTEREVTKEEISMMKAGEAGLREKTHNQNPREQGMISNQEMIKDLKPLPQSVLNQILKLRM